MNLNRFTEVYRRDGREALTAAVQAFSLASKTALLAAVKEMPRPRAERD